MLRPVQKSVPINVIGSEVDSAQSHFSGQWGLADYSGWFGLRAGWKSPGTATVRTKYP